MDTTNAKTVPLLIDVAHRQFQALNLLTCGAVGSQQFVFLSEVQHSATPTSHQCNSLRVTETRWDVPFFGFEQLFSVQETRDHALYILKGKGGKQERQPLIPAIEKS